MGPANDKQTLFLNVLLSTFIDCVNVFDCRLSAVFITFLTLVMVNTSWTKHLPTLYYVNQQNSCCKHVLSIRLVNRVDSNQMVSSYANRSEFAVFSRYSVAIFHVLFLPDF